MKIKNFYTVFVFFTGLILISTIIIVLVNRNRPYRIILNNYAAGRLGDQIIGYSKAKWLSHKYGIPFRLIPFKDYDQLNISKEQCYTDASYFFNRIFYKLFGRLVWVDSEEDLVNALTISKWPTRFVAHINTRLYEHINSNTGINKTDYSWVPSVVYEIMLQNSGFSEKLRYMLKPTIKIDRINLPNDRITVAVHIRKGGGFDSQLLSKQYYNEESLITKYKQSYINFEHDELFQNISQNIPSADCNVANDGSADRIYLDKFLPEQYYVKQIQNLSDFFGDAPLYVYIFTDDSKPVELMNRIKKATKKTNIIFDCRKLNNRYDANILYDLYAMADFDCMIRSGSCFAYVSQMIGNHKIIVYPLHLKWIDNEILVADRVGVILRDKNKYHKKFGGENLVKLDYEDK